MKNKKILFSVNIILSLIALFWFRTRYSREVKYPAEAGNTSILPTAVRNTILHKLKLVYHSGV